MTHAREFGEVVPQKFNYNGQRSTTNAVSLYNVSCAQTELHISTNKQTKKGHHRNSRIRASNT